MDRSGLKNLYSAGWQVNKDLDKLKRSYPYAIAFLEGRRYRSFSIKLELLRDIARALGKGGKVE